MADFATIADVESRWRTLSPGRPEYTNAQTWLTDASSELRVEIPTIDDLVGADADYARQITAAVAEAVAAKLRGVYDTRDWYRRSFFTADQIRSLSVGQEGSGAFTVTMYSAGPGYRTDSETWE